MTIFESKEPEPKGRIGVQKNFAIVVPDSALQSLNRPRRFMPIINSAMIAKRVLRRAQYFGSYWKFRRKVSNAKAQFILKSLNDHSDTLTPADTCGCQTIAPATPVKLAQQSQNQPGTSCSQRMAERNRAAVYICSTTIET